MEDQLALVTAEENRETAAIGARRPGCEGRTAKRFSNDDGVKRYLLGELRRAAR